jgi:hypothetical protein
MIQVVNERRASARVLHTLEDLVREKTGSLWREASVSPQTLGRDGGNPPYVMATGSGNPDTAYVAFCMSDGSGYTTDEDHGVFLPSEHQPNFPLTEVTDGTHIRIG